MTTDSGEEFKKPIGLLSSLLDIGYRGSGEYNVTVAYILDKYKAEDISLDINLPE